MTPTSNDPASDYEAWHRERPDPGDMPGKMNGHDTAPMGGDMAPEFSDDQLADAFVCCGGENFRWTPHLGWMVDARAVWTPDDALRRYDLARKICRQHAALARLKPGTASVNEAKRLASARTHAAVLAVAQSDPRIVVPVSEWDTDPMMLNTPGGVVDLSTGTIQPRGRGYYTQMAVTAPDYAAPCPRWLQFLHEVFEDDPAMIDFVQRSCGYWLSGDRREQVIHFMAGVGSNGKSVLMDLIAWLMGTYAIKLPANVLMLSKGERHPTELAQLHHKRLAVSSELEEGTFFHESLLKELSGDEKFRARFMRQDFFEFTLTHKHVIVGNYRPRLRGGDPAMARRLLLVPFSAVFKGENCDPLMLEKLKAEGPAILAWLIEGTLRWQADGLGVPANVRVASAEYMAEHDDIALWIDEWCARDPQAETRATDLYASFALWKTRRGEHAPSQTAWGSRIANVPGIAKRHSNGIRYTGLRLTAESIEAVYAMRR